jgi:hypothetical protein
MFLHMPGSYRLVRFGSQTFEHRAAGPPERERFIDWVLAMVGVPGGGGHEQDNFGSALHVKTPLACVVAGAARDAHGETSGKTHARSRLVDHVWLFGPVVGDDVRGRPSLQPRNALVSSVSSVGWGLPRATGKLSLAAPWARKRTTKARSGKETNASRSYTSDPTLIAHGSHAFQEIERPLIVMDLVRGREVNGQPTQWLVRL